MEKAKKSAQLGRHKQELQTPPNTSAHAWKRWLRGCAHAPVKHLTKMHFESVDLVFLVVKNKNICSMYTFKKLAFPLIEPPPPKKEPNANVYIYAQSAIIEPF